jgi:SNF2 family DNA or RNA helicase
MATQMLKPKCPYCNKLVHEKGRDTFGNELWISLECGHTIIQDALVSTEVNIVSSDGKRPFPFQMEDVAFLEAADCNGLCNDEPGLGKTVVECILLSRNPALLPALIVVNSGLRIQWFTEIFRWTGIAAQVISKSTEQPFFEFFKIVIVSLDTLRLIRPDVKVESDWDKEKRKMAGKKPRKTTPLWSDETCAQFKHICVDESQRVKNAGSSRTQALRLIAKLANDGKKARVICLSGTPIEKHAGEYFVTLNLVRPEIFNNESTYQLQHCEINKVTGKIGGLKNPTRFRELTKDFIIRHKTDDVAPELPKVFRQFRLADIEGDELEAYIKIVKEFNEYMDDEDLIKTPNGILAFLTRMRHITGVAKVNAAVEFVEEFLLGSEPERKLVIFTQHILAAQLLTAKLSQLCTDGAFAQPLSFHAGLNAYQRVALVEEFKKPGNRIMVASTGASGTGVDGLQEYCHDCLIMERQWNPSTEEQAEGRFRRFQKMTAYADRVNAVYLIAAGTIDDFFTDIVEVKRRNVKQTLDGEEITWDETSLIMQLAGVLKAKGLQKWSLASKF